MAGVGLGVVGVELAGAGLATAVTGVAVLGSAGGLGVEAQPASMRLARSAGPRLLRAEAGK